MATEQDSPEELLPELNVFFVSGGRHDRDRIEIQIGFDGLIPPSASRHFQYDVDCIVFAPKTLGLLDVDNSQSLRTEFQSYFRLHTHVSNPKSETSLPRVKERLEALKSRLTLDTVRIFAIEFEGYLKGQTKRVKKRVDSTLIVTHELESVQYFINDFRSILRARNLEGQNVEFFTRGSVDHDLLLLNEYVSHVYVQFLSETFHATRAMPDGEPILAQVEKSIRAETEVRMQYGFLIERRHGPQSSADEENYLRRIGLLKKYFQKAIFVQVVGNHLENRLRLPTLGLSAALAASWTIMIQLYQANTVAERVGINTIALITVGVAAYVAKDLMKDFFRRYFLTAGSKLFPDYERKLFINRGAKKVRLGRVKEYLRTFDSEELSAELGRTRYGSRGGELEEHLHEDVLHFRKHVTLDLSSFEVRQEFPWGLREVLRYRFDRLTTSMEDPFKTLHLISQSGMPTARQAHRIYHLHFAVWIQPHEIDLKPPIRPAFKAYRVVLDKGGVLECTQVDWTAHGIPQAP